MVSRILLILSLSTVLMGASSCPASNKYGAPKFEDCTILTLWDEVKEVETATLFCIEPRMNEKFYTNTFVPSVLDRFNEHPLREAVINYLETNKKEIIKTKEYELPITYGRGSTSISPSDRTLLFKWAEENRIKRIECEYNR